MHSVPKMHATCVLYEEMKIKRTKVAFELQPTMWRRADLHKLSVLVPDTGVWIPASKIFLNFLVFLGCGNFWNYIYAVFVGVLQRSDSRS